MQTFVIKIEDNFMQDFLNIVEQYKDKIQLQKDKNLEYDPYFYDRKRDLEEIINESENGNMELLSQEQYTNEMVHFFDTLKK